VITDTMMPMMSGYSLTTTIRKNLEYGKIPILMLTRRRERDDVKKAIEAGVTDYAVKPIDESLLLDKLQLCLMQVGGTRHVFQCPVIEPQSSAQFQLDCKVVSMSETDLTVKFPIAIPTGTSFFLANSIFEEIGIKTPEMKIMRCEPSNVGSFSKAFPFEAVVSFMGVVENDLRKIRNWLKKQELRLRK
jgi:DNA-binding response OmpR family regulator